MDKQAILQAIQAERARRAQQIERPVPDLYDVNAVPAPNSNTGDLFGESGPGEIVRPEGRMQLSQNGAPDKQQLLQAIQAERERRVAEAEAVPRGTMDDLKHKGRLFGEHAIKSATGAFDLPVHAAKLLAAPESPIGRIKHYPSEYAQRILGKLGLDLNTQKPESMADRIIGHAGDIGGGVGGFKAAGAALKGVKGGLSALKGMLSPKALWSGAKELAGAAGTGAASQGLQEMGVNPLVADIGAAVAPSAYRSIFKPRTGLTAAEESVGRRMTNEIEANQRVAGEAELPKVIEELGQERALKGYTPTSAEMTKNPVFVKIERASKSKLRGAIDKSGELNQAIRAQLKEMVPGDSDIMATKELFDQIVERANKRTTHIMDTQFGGKLSSADASEIIQDSLHKELLKHKGVRESATAPLYAARDASPTLIQPNKTQALITEKLKTAQGKTKKALIEIQKMLEIEGQKSTEKVLQGYEHLPKPAYDALRKQYLAELPPTGHTAASLKGVSEEASDMIESALVAGKKKKARALMEAKGALKEDLSAVPESAAADKLFAQLSPPVNALEENPVFGKLIKRTTDNKGFEVLYPTGIPEKITKNRKVAKDFLKQTVERPEARKAVEFNANKDFVDFVSDKHGKLTDFESVVAWKKKMKAEHPGLFDIYPQLETKLSNLQNSRVLFNSAKKGIEKNIDEYYKKVFQAVSNEKPEYIVSGILGGNTGPLKARQAVELTKLDKSGTALEGLQRTIIDHIEKRATVGGSDSLGFKNMTYGQFKKAFDSNKKSLQEIFTPEQMKTWEAIEEGLSHKARVATQASAIGSPTAANLSIFDIVNNNLTNSNVINSIGWSTLGRLYYLPKAFIQVIRKTSQAVSTARTDEVMKRMLLDKDYAKLLLTKIKDIPEATWKNAIKGTYAGTNKAIPYTAVTQAVNKKEESK